ncbi:uncharacterized protein LOC133797826 [Humulus lupulus]|uniref:uncharacterized protein LOC133797826 n=1 Tax=Humulus lupulus TaxID=3486 RepID=UPI002B4142EE|nr:uncharacterized protein LOC133797826 [Humulus lupulus]
MEMEVVMPVPPADFNFDSTCSSPYMTAPSSPQRFGNFFYSAPTSPTRVSAAATLYGVDLSLISGAGREIPSRSLASSIPFKWEEKPGVPKGKITRTGENDTIESRNDNENQDEVDDDFEFNFSGQLEKGSLSAADELFDGGKIRPLKPPPRLQVRTCSGNYDSGPSSVTSPRSPRSRISQGKKMVQDVLMSPRRKRDENFDPFTAAVEETRKKESNQDQEPNPEKLGRGRERSVDHNQNSSSNFARKGTRSLSPMRVSDALLFDAEENSSQFSGKIVPDPNSTTNNSRSAYSSILSAISFAKDYRKWKLKDLLLFRSASEGRASSVSESFRKYAVLSKKSAPGPGTGPATSAVATDDVRNSSFRSTDSVGSVSSRRRGPPVSAHELHYTVNRAVSEEMKKKTFLPYKQGLLGCLGFNPGVHEISRSFGSLSRA